MAPLWRQAVLVKPRVSSSLSSPGKDPKQPQPQPKPSKPLHVKFDLAPAPPTAPAPAAPSQPAPANRRRKSDATANDSATNASAQVTDGLPLPVSNGVATSAASLQAAAKRHKAREQAQASRQAALATTATGSSGEMQAGASSLVYMLSSRVVTSDAHVLEQGGLAELLTCSDEV